MSVRLIPAAPWTGRDDAEDGVDAKRIHAFAASHGPRALIGFACDAGITRNGGRPGASLGPAALRTALSGLSAPASAAPFADLGDVQVTGDDLEAGQSLLGEQIRKALANHERVLVLGGGHETAYGSYLGLASFFKGRKIGIINLDAHLDLRSIGAAGPSSGTMFNQIRTRAPDQFDYLCLGLAEEANTRALLDRAEAWGVRTVSDHALIKNPSAADHEIAAMIARCDLIYLTICMDVLPHYQAPGVSAPAARGVPLSTIEHLVQTALDTCKAQACKLPLVDLVELSPPHDLTNMTARTGAVLLRKVLF